MSLEDIYTQLILEESRNTRNRRSLDEKTHQELGHNPSCGDEITLELNIKDDIIEEASYTGHGCAISQASTSIMCDTIRNKKVEEAKVLADNFINMIKGEELKEEEMDDLGDSVAFENIKNLPARVKCAVLPWYTLKEIFSN